MNADIKHGISTNPNLEYIVLLPRSCDDDDDDVEKRNFVHATKMVDFHGQQNALENIQRVK